MSQARKFDQGKEPMDLLPHESLQAIARVLAFGEKKYSAGNWAKGLEYRRLIAAAMRHLGAFNSGEDKDPESGLCHIDHAACCLLFLSYMVQKRPDLDNRWATGEQPPAGPGAKGPKPLTVQIGKYYRRRDGVVVGPAREGFDSVYPGYRGPVFFVGNGNGYMFRYDGTHHYGVTSVDLVEEVG